MPGRFKLGILCLRTSLPLAIHFFICSWEESERTAFLPLASKELAWRLCSWQTLLSWHFPLVSRAPMTWGTALPLQKKNNSEGEKGSVGLNPHLEWKEKASRESPDARAELAPLWSIPCHVVLGTVGMISACLPLIFEITMLSQMTEMWPAIHPWNSQYLEAKQ